MNKGLQIKFKNFDNEIEAKNYNSIPLNKKLLGALICLLCHLICYPSFQVCNLSLVGKIVLP